MHDHQFENSSFPQFDFIIYELKGASKVLIRCYWVSRLNKNRSLLSTNFNTSLLIVLYYLEGSQENDTKQGIEWTNGIDELFVKTEEDSNGNDDQEPYMWMYFGSTLGFVRHYPANQWQVEATGSPFQDVCIV